MPQPRLKKYPAEIFGYPYSDNSAEAIEARESQWCPFLQGECKKPRKSQPHIKVGICSVGYKVHPSRKHEPVIICPHRFDLDVVFDAVVKYALGPVPVDQHVIRASEVSLGNAGSVDYVVANAKDIMGVPHIQDFVGIELQAAGTTGTPWQAVVELKEHGKLLQDSYQYGINWANEFAKTMMQQAYKKGLLIESWGKRLVFAIQDVGLEYLSRAYDTSDLHQAQDSHGIHFYTFKMTWNEDMDSWGLQLDRRLSTNTEGIRKILGGQAEDKFLEISKFHDNIRKKVF